MNLHEFYKEHYFFEADRRHKLTSSLSMPVGVLTVLVGGLIAIAKDLHSPLGEIELIEVGLLVISTGLSAATIYFLVRSYFNYSYGYIATADQLKKYYEDMVSYSKINNDAEHDRAEGELEEYINSEYAKYSHQNCINNDLKSYYLHKANGCLIAALISVSIAAIPYIINSAKSGEKVQKIEIVNLNKRGGEIMAEDNKPATTPTQVVKPTPPPGRIIKEGEEPRKK